MNDYTAIGIIPLEQLYITAIAGVCNALKLDVCLQDLGNGNGRLWLVSNGSTVPQAWLAFSFNDDAVNLALGTRDERSLVRVVKYAEGIDGFLSELSRFLAANRITHRRSA